VSAPALPAERLIPAHWPRHPWDWIQWAEFSHPLNMSWNPASTVPCGFTKAGLPVGMQIVGRRFDDPGVMQTSRAFRRIQPCADKRPKVDWQDRTMRIGWLPPRSAGCAPRGTPPPNARATTGAATPCCARCLSMPPMCPA